MKPNKKINRIDLEGAYLIFAKSKLVLSIKGESYHYTLHMGPDSGVFDIHRTAQVKDGTDPHKTIYSIRHESFFQLIEEIMPTAFVTLKRILKPLDLDWMEEQQIGVIVGIPVSKDETQAVSVNRKRTLSIDKQKIIEQLWAPDFLEDLYELKDGQTFTLFRTTNPLKPKKIGTGFVFTDKRKGKQLMWLQDNKMGEAIERIGALLNTAAAKYGTFHNE